MYAERRKIADTDTSVYKIVLEQENNKTSSLLLNPRRNRVVKRRFF